MKGISKLAWLGLALNIGYLAVVWYITTQTADLYQELKPFAQNAVDFLTFMLLPFLLSVLLQIISLPVLFKHAKWGLGLAITGSLAILPLGLLFLIGYLFSYERFRNRPLQLLAPGEKEKLSSQLIFKTSMFFVQGLITLGIGLFILLDGVSVGWLLVCSGLLFFSNAIRLNQRIMIGVLNDKLVITPALYAETYLIPLQNVTLIKENKNLFKLHLFAAGVDRKCTFSKKMISGEDSQKVLADILSKLATEDNAEKAVGGPAE